MLTYYSLKILFLMSNYLCIAFQLKNDVNILKTNYFPDKQNTNYFGKITNTLIFNMHSMKTC